MRDASVFSYSHTGASIQMPLMPIVTAGRISDRRLFPTIHAFETFAFSLSKTQRMVDVVFSRDNLDDLKKKPIHSVQFDPLERPDSP